MFAVRFVSQENGFCRLKNSLAGLPVVQLGNCAAKGILDLLGSICAVEVDADVRRENEEHMYYPCDRCVPHLQSDYEMFKTTPTARFRNCPNDPLTEYVS